MNDIDNSHPVDSLTLVQNAIEKYKNIRGSDPKHLVVPKIILNSLKEMKPSDEPFEITKIYGIPVSSSKETVVIESSEL